MTKILNYRLEIAADDDVAAEAVKAKLREHIRSLGRHDDFGDPAEGQATADRAVMFDGASVKTFIAERKRATQPAANGKAKP